MGKFKKRLSKILAIALITSFLAQPGIPVFAVTAQEVLESAEVSENAEDLISAKEEEAISESDIAPEGTLQESSESTEIQTNSEEQKVITNLEEQRIDTNQDTAKNTEIVDSSDDISAYSLLPIKEKYAFLMLNNYSEEEIKAMPLETVLSLLIDSNGESIEISKDANVVWAYFKDEDGYVLSDEYHVIGRGETVDLSSRLKNTTSYRMELIIGSGKQLDPDNIRYIVTVYISDIRETINYQLYEERYSYRREVVDSDKIIFGSSSILGDIDIPVTAVSYITSSHEEGNRYYLGIDSAVALDAKRQNIKVDIYPMKNFLEYYQNGASLDGAITDQILNQKNMSRWGGYLGTYTSPGSLANPLDADNIFCIVYKDAGTDKIIGYQGLVFIVREESLDVTGRVLAYENGQIMKNITKEENSSDGRANWKINPASESNGVIVSYSVDRKEYDLIEGYPSDAEYYYALYSNEHVEKVVLGRFDTLKEAEDAEAKDITAQILPSDRNQKPYGYQANFDKAIYITIFFDDSTVLKYQMNVESIDADVFEYNDAPVVNEVDPYFNVTGVVSYSAVYVVKNDETTLDTLYGYGYQTLLIDDNEADLTKLKPDFWCYDGVKVHVGVEQIPRVSEQDFSKGPVYYAVHIGNNLKNYQVTFVKKESGPKLFVNGPSERAIFLDEYFENRHDILIANIGDEELTGLKVELLDATNVKLDDYWVVGGEKNNTLAAFDGVYTSSRYGELDNLAKIRLLPDGDGDITGTLKISADNQEDIYIKLTGHAGNPKIITEGLSDAVKYVPYSYVVATDNMHDWNRVTFHITEGKLPEGLQLYPDTGEIYGVPLETGEFPITVEAAYSREEYEPSYAKFTLVVKENTNDNVYISTDEGYVIKEHIGTETASGTHDYVLWNINDQLFVSSGEYNEFIDFWLNGEKLIEGEDYVKDSGSTKITIRSQTFREKAKNGSNTIAAEFRVDGDRSKELKRTAQNFRINFKQIENNDTDDESDNNSSSSDNDNSNESSTSNSHSSSSNTGSSGTNVNNTNVAISYSDDSWIRDNKGWQCKMPNGSHLTNTWCKLPYNGTNEWYYFNEQGYMVTGWFTNNGQWYYLNPISDGTQGRMFTNWRLIDGKWCYFNESSDGIEGALVINTWCQLPYNETNEWYYFDEQGYMSTGWIKNNGLWYYLNPISDGTQGKMSTGWQLIDGKWYYFNEISDGTKGALVTDAWIGNFYVNKNGVWVNEQ